MIQATCTLQPVCSRILSGEGREKLFFDPLEDELVLRAEGEHAVGQVVELHAAEPLVERRRRQATGVLDRPFEDGPAVVSQNRHRRPARPADTPPHPSDPGDFARPHLLHRAPASPQRARNGLEFTTKTNPAPSRELSYPQALHEVPLVWMCGEVLETIWKPSSSRPTRVTKRNPS